MKLPPLRIGEIEVPVPIIQGGMGVGVSLSGLASAVANEGGVGVISGAQIGFREPDFSTNLDEANLRALRREIRRARSLSPNGIIGVNLMVAQQNYDIMVKTAAEEGADLIISGAGLPTGLPHLAAGSKAKLVPIVSSGRAASVITKLWDNRYSYMPDMVIVEGPEAGGHLGFKPQELVEGKKPDLKDIVLDVIKAMEPFEKKYGRKVPVIAAGGIYTGKDIAEFIKLGASGVQMATRFVGTEECDADIKFKEAYINAKKEDIIIVKSPVGLPGRAIKNEFIDAVAVSREPIKKCFKCIKGCDPKTTPYCITKALVNSVNGNLKEGLVFTGSNSYRMDHITTVKELIAGLIKEAGDVID